MENLNKKKTASEATAEMLSMIRKGTITPIHNQFGNIVGFNMPGKSTGIQCAKIVDGHMTVGATEEERAADEAALKAFLEEWSQNDVYRIFTLAVRMNSADITAAELDSIRKELDRMDGKDTVQPAATRPSEPRSSYQNLAEDLGMLGDEELRKLMNRARRENKRDLYNASRKILRHRGYSC